MKSMLHNIGLLAVCCLALAQAGCSDNASPAGAASNGKGTTLTPADAEKYDLENRQYPDGYGSDGDNKSKLPPLPQPIAASFYKNYSLSTGMANGSGLADLEYEVERLQANQSKDDLPSLSIKYNTRIPIENAPEDIEIELMGDVLQVEKKDGRVMVMSSYLDKTAAPFELRLALLIPKETGFGFNALVRKQIDEDSYTEVTIGVSSNDRCTIIRNNDNTIKFVCDNLKDGDRIEGALYIPTSAS